MFNEIKTDKDCTYSAGLLAGGFVVDLTLPDTPGQPEKSLARHLCRCEFEPEEIAQIVLDLRWSTFLRAVSRGMGVEPSTSLNDIAMISKVKQFYAAGRKAEEAIKALKKTLSEWDGESDGGGPQSAPSEPEYGSFGL